MVDGNGRERTRLRPNLRSPLGICLERLGGVGGRRSVGVVSVPAGIRTGTSDIDYSRSYSSVLSGLSICAVLTIYLPNYAR
jgi:hypothetical protein